MTLWSWHNATHGFTKLVLPWHHSLACLASWTSLTDPCQWPTNQNITDNRWPLTRQSQAVWSLRWLPLWCFCLFSTDGWFCTKILFIKYFYFNTIVAFISIFLAAKRSVVDESCIQPLVAQLQFYCGFKHISCRILSVNQ